MLKKLTFIFLILFWGFVAITIKHASWVKLAMPGLVLISQISAYICIGLVLAILGVALFLYFKNPKTK